MTDYLSERDRSEALRAAQDQWLDAHSELQCRAIVARSVLRCLIALSYTETEAHTLIGFRTALAFVVAIQGQDEELETRLKTLESEVSEASEAYNSDKRRDSHIGTNANTLGISAVRMTLLACWNSIQSVSLEDPKSRRSYIRSAAHRQGQCANQLGRSEALRTSPQRASSGQPVDVNEAMWDAILTSAEWAHDDTKLFDIGSESHLFGTPLWRNLPEAHWTTVNWEKLRTGSLALIAGSSFWQRWYQGFLDGSPVDWELQKRVAFIEQEDWERGARHIDRLIAEIEVHIELRRKIRELEKELATASVSRLGIGGNNPPEPIADTPSIARELTLIWVPLQQLKEEMEADVPDKVLLGEVIDALRNGLNKGITWSASKADLVVDTAIKWGIPAAGGGYLAMNPDRLSAAIEAAQKWLNLLN